MHFGGQHDIQGVIISSKRVHLFNLYLLWEHYIGARNPLHMVNPDREGLVVPERMKAEGASSSLLVSVLPLKLKSEKF